MHTNKNFEAHQNERLANEQHSPHERSTMRTLLIIASMTTMMYVMAFLWLVMN